MRRLGIDVDRLPDACASEMLRLHFIIGVAARAPGLWIVVMGGDAVMLAPVSADLPGTQWARARSLLLATSATPRLFVALTHGAFIIGIAEVHYDASWWDALCAAIGAPAARDLETFVTQADALAFMGAVGQFGTFVCLGDGSHVQI